MTPDDDDAVFLSLSNPNVGLPSLRRFALLLPIVLSFLLVVLLFGPPRYGPLRTTTTATTVSGRGALTHTRVMSFKHARQTFQDTRRGRRLLSGHHLIISKNVSSGH